MVAATKADIVCFQEVFLEEDRRTLCEVLATEGLLHYRYFSSLPGGSGLLTISRFPIVEAVFQRFREQGNPLALQQGDWWAGKGAGLVTVDVAEFGKIRVINTHIHASYQENHYQSLRQEQIGELLSLAERGGANGGPIFIIGDLNYGKDDLFWRNFLKTHQLQELSRRWSPVDYIMALKSDRFTFLHSTGERLTGALSDGTTVLSDHAGILTDVHITDRVKGTGIRYSP